MMRVLVLLMALVVSPVWAATVAELEGISAGERDKVGAIFNQQQRNFLETCTSVKVLKASAMSVAEPVVLDALGKPTAGRWHVRYAVDACGKAALRMMEFKVVPGGIALEAMVPGETLADPKLQGDVLKSFGMAGRVAMPQCGEEAVVRETRVRVYPGKPNDRWMELWLGHMCGRDLGQVVEFLPTKGGTTFKMSLPKQSVK